MGVAATLPELSEWTLQSHRKIPKVQNFKFSSFLSEKNSIVLAG